MIHPTRVGIGIAVVFLSMAGSVFAQGADPAKLWDDFNHYILIARPELAQGIGTQLLSIDDATLLDVVEASSYTNYENTLNRATRIDTLKTLGEEMIRKIQSARIERSREKDRIQADINRLGEGGRAYLNALDRLRGAGQYAAPALLANLRNEHRRALHPYILSAMVAIGRPLVYPLCIALPQLEPIQQGQVAQVLSEIGYPRALPYLREVIESPTTDGDARRIAESAYRHLAQTAGLPANVTAAELYFLLAQNHYDSGRSGADLPGYDSAQRKGIIWEFLSTVDEGLIPIAVPTEIFGYALSIRAAKRALELNPHLSPALSLWLMANLNRENHLPAGQKDPSYGEDMLEPSFYLRAAGPLRQHDVLHRALADRDAPLALDAIDGLAATAGTEALINREGTVQPLLQALAYPDRRVRFQAAFTMTNARPNDPFPGSHRVVPVLAEAVRQTEERTAVVIGRDAAQTQELAAILREDMGMKTIAGDQLNDILEAVHIGPGVDLIVTHISADAVSDFQRQRATIYKLAAAPLLAMVDSASELMQVTSRFENEPSVVPMLRATSASELRPAVDAALAKFAGDVILEDEALALATKALTLLREVAIGTDRVYRVVDAEPSLIQALGDRRDPIVVGTGQVLALIPSETAQRAIAEAALDSTRASTLRIPLLDSLADSAKAFGNRLTDPQLEKVLELVKTERGDLALAAARAHGALTLPTSNIVQMITGK